MDCILIADLMSETEQERSLDAAKVKCWGRGLKRALGSGDSRQDKPPVNIEFEGAPCFELPVEFPSDRALRLVWRRARYCLAVSRWPQRRPHACA